VWAVWHCGLIQASSLQIVYIQLVDNISILFGLCREFTCISEDINELPRCI
jgi:hypothetical protein